MTTFRNTVRWSALPACLCAMLVLATGCPILDGTTKVTAVLSADLGATKALDGEPLIANGDLVALEEIESLTLTVTQIVLVPIDDVEEEGEPEEPEDPEKAAVPDSHVLIFDGSMDVDLKDLVGVSEVISSSVIPADVYGQLRLSIENPRLVFVGGDPENPVTDVHLTASGRVFFTQEFEIVEGQNSLLIIDLGGIHLVENGNGGYVLTPQLTADITVADANVMAMGTVVAVDTEGKVLTLDIADGSGEVEVDYSAAQIYLPTDVPDVPSGAEADLVLAIGGIVDVAGPIDVSGNITANTIRILP
jgi:uncharacterized protein DUF4382